MLHVPSTSGTWLHNCSDYHSDRTFLDADRGSATHPMRSASYPTGDRESKRQCVTIHGLPTELRGPTDSALTSLVSSAIDFLEHNGANYLMVWLFICRAQEKPIAFANKREVKLTLAPESFIRPKQCYLGHGRRHKGPYYIYTAAAMMGPSKCFSPVPSLGTINRTHWLCCPLCQQIPTILRGR